MLIYHTKEAIMEIRRYGFNLPENLEIISNTQKEKVFCKYEMGGFVNLESSPYIILRTNMADNLTKNSIQWNDAWIKYSNIGDCNFAPKLFVDETPKGIVTHELAHAVHFKANPDKYNELKLDINTVTNELGEDSKYYKEFEYNKVRIIAEASMSAAANPLDFVAEIFVGKLNGKNYSDTINYLYEKYGGPKFFNLSVFNY